MNNRRVCVHCGESNFYYGDYTNPAWLINCYACGKPVGLKDGTKYSECWCGAKLKTESSYDKHIAKHVLFDEGMWKKEGSRNPAQWNYWNFIMGVVYHRDKGICQVCKRTYGELKQLFPDRVEKYLPLSEIHHIIPRCKGGTDNTRNLILLCFDCHNRTKRNKNYGGIPQKTTKTIQRRLSLDSV